MPHLQPYSVFNAEATRLNTLYWSSRYSYDKTERILKLIADTGHSLPDPRVDVLWGSNETGLASVTTVPFSNFQQVLQNNLASLRMTSILHICSAFENALCGYYALGGLYEPSMEDSTKTNSPLPLLLKNTTNFQARKLAIFNKCELVMKGSYTKRINSLINIWALPPIAVASMTRLNGYQKKRHLIAHDQGIANADSPENSAIELISARLSITETEWKNLISDFTIVLNELDSRFSTQIVNDSGISLAIFRIIERDGSQLLGELCSKIIDEWRTGPLRKSTVKKIATNSGFTIKQVNANTYSVSR